MLAGNTEGSTKFKNTHTHTHTHKLLYREPANKERWFSLCRENKWLV